MATTVFGAGAAEPLKVVQTPVVVPTDLRGKPVAAKPVYFEGGLNAGLTKGAAVANATDAATAITQLNALLASLRAAGVIAP